MSADEPKDGAEAARPKPPAAELTLSPETQSKIRHDLRTPINQILGYSELLQEEAESSGPEAFIPDLKKIQVATRRLLGLVDTMFSAPEMAAPAPPQTDNTGMRFRAYEPEEAGAPAPEPAAPVAAPGDTLLVVDDNELNRDMLSRRLRGRGYTVGMAEDGEQALAKIGAERFDAVLLDVMMPGISGLEVLAELRKKHAAADLPVIMATARDDSEDIVEALKLGANDYVTKPLDFPVVLARVETQLSLKKAKEKVQRLAEELERRNRFIRKTFGRYLSDDVVASLLESEEGLKLGGENRTVTMMMSDLRGFTAASERLAPEQVVRALNIYLGAMAEIITRFRGTIDEFIGDAIFTVFGAPFAFEDDAERAVACALAMQGAMEAVNREIAQEGLPNIEMGIAVNTGEVVVGNIGSQTRAKYGIVGSHVNLTARIESFSVGGQVLISDSTRRLAGEGVAVGKTYSINAKGFSEPITAYELLGISGKYGYQIPRSEERWISLPSPIPVRFTELKDKQVGVEAYDGHIVRLSAKKAEVRTVHEVPVLSNLKLRLTVAGAEIPADLYGKVTEAATAGEPGFTVHFTAIPPEIHRVLDPLLS